jgi:hypothetical protein
LDQLHRIVDRLAALLPFHEQLDAAHESALSDPFTTGDLGLSE